MVVVAKATSFENFSGSLSLSFRIGAKIGRKVVLAILISYLRGYVLDVQS